MNRADAEKHVDSILAARKASGRNDPPHLRFISIAALLDESELTREEAEHNRLYSRQVLAYERSKNQTSSAPSIEQSAEGGEDAPEKRVQKRTRRRKSEVSE